MKCKILHESQGRMRVRALQPRMTVEQADILEYYLKAQEGVIYAKVNDRTADAIISYEGTREGIVLALSRFSYEENVALVPDHTGRALNREYEDKLVLTVVNRVVNVLFFPVPLKRVLTGIKAIPYVLKGIGSILKGKIEVALLDAVAISASILTGDYDTASSVMFLLGIGEILEEWTHKKSVDDLARTMSLDVDKVWTLVQGEEVLLPVNEVQVGAEIIVRTGNMIPLDGKLSYGEAMVNQASMTGESVPVRKTKGSYAYAGTVVEEGECHIIVEKEAGSGRYDRIVKMIEESEKLKSSTEDKASHLADKLVPYSLGGAALAYLFTRNVTKALAFLMVDFSCALKLSMPVAVLSAMREAGKYHISVKGGKFMEVISEADTIVFDKTGTLTKGNFVVKSLCPEEGISEDVLLNTAAIVENGSTHPIAQSILQAYKERWFGDQELLTPEEIVNRSGKGLIARVQSSRVLVGNEKLMEEFGIAYQTGEQNCATVCHVAVDSSYLGKIYIADEIKENSHEAIMKMKEEGVKEIVMLTGDSRPVAEEVGEILGVDRVYSELLPANKVEKVEELLRGLKKDGKQSSYLAFVGDGINDAPVLSRSDVGIAMGGMGSDAAIEAADIVIMDDDLLKIPRVISLGRRTVRIATQNIAFALGVKILVLLLSAFGFANMWAAVFADVGVTVICIVNAMRLLKRS